MDLVWIGDGGGRVGLQMSLEVGLAAMRVGLRRLMTETRIERALGQTIHSEIVNNIKNKNPSSNCISLTVLGPLQLVGCVS